MEDGVRTKEEEEELARVAADLDRALAELRDAVHDGSATLADILKQNA